MKFLPQRKKLKLRDVRHMEEVIKSIKFINEKFEEMEDDRKEQEKRQISKLRNEVKNLNEIKR